MSTTADLLSQLKNGKPRRIRGQTVRKDGESFDIDGDTFDLAGAITKLDQAAAPKVSDYASFAFLEQPPYSSRFIAQHYCATKADYTALVNAVKQRKNYLYYGTVKKDGERFIVNPPFILDWDTVPPHPDEVAKMAAPPDPARWGGDLSCPFCHTEVSSTPGRTLHVKAAHPERVEEYNALLERVTNEPVDADVADFNADVEPEPGEEDVVDLMDTRLKCPYCTHKINSTSGRTLHVKSKHPERFAEYQQGNT